MDGSDRRDATVNAIWFLAFALASSIWCWTAAEQLGATFDEPIYLEEGLKLWHTGSHKGLMKLGTMPLPVDAVTFPVFVWEKLQGRAYNAETDLATVLPIARHVTLGFWWLLLYFAWKSAFSFAGSWGGRLTIALICCEPTFLAHACLATTDIAVTAMLVALIYYYRSGFGQAWRGRIALPALWYGLAIAAKASGLVFGGLLMVALEFGQIIQGKPLKKSILDLTQVGLMGLAAALVLCGSDFQAQPSFVEWAQRQSGTAGRIWLWLAEHLCIFANAGEGIVRQFKHNVRGHGSFLLGETHPRALWYYFPIALTIKLALPTLLLPGAVALRSARALANPWFLLALLLLLFTVTCRVQIGVRLVLPLVALWCIGTGIGLALAWKPGSQRLGWLPGVVAAGLFAWSAAEAGRAWPDALRYANAAWGGPERAYLLLSDSNHDWGQGIPELIRWRNDHGAAPLSVWYFGKDVRVGQPPLAELPLHALEFNEDRSVEEATQGGYLAVSTTLLHGSIGSALIPAQRASFERVAAYLKRQIPVDRTSTFLIFDMRKNREGEDRSPPLHGISD